MAIPTLYRTGEKDVVLLHDLLILLKKDRDWVDSTLIDSLANLPTRYCFRLEAEQKWMLEEQNPDDDVFAVTETGAYFVISHLQNDEKTDLLSITKDVFSKRPELPQPKISDKLFSNLSPLQSGIDEGQREESIDYYHSILNNAIANHSIRNIAIAAPYGAGKSTIINSFFENKEAIYISLGTFDDDEPGKKITKEYERQRVEKNILQQLIYQSDPNVLPESRILRIYHIDDRTRRKRIVDIIGFALSIFLIKIGQLFPVLETDDGYLGITVFLKVLGVLGAVFIAAPIVFNLIKNVKNIKVSKFSTLAGDVELSHGSQFSVFNQYMDELLYFFERTPFKYVIIEDLDRFGDVEIFGRLRSLNQTLNKYPRLSERNIVFIYAMRDDIFTKDHRDRTKFFDLIVPIVPIINSSNSKDKFKALLTKEVIRSCELDEFFIDEVSDHIQDMRLLKNIVNEFFVYWRLLRNKYQYDGNELLAAIIYKNLVPDDFAAYHENTGTLKYLKMFKECLYDFANSNDPKALTDKEDKLLKINDISLKMLIDSLYGGTFETPVLHDYLKSIRIPIKSKDEWKSVSLYDTYLKSPLLLSLLTSGYLNENVKEYISYIHLDALNNGEQQYVKAINQRIEPENLTIPITRRLVEKIYLGVFDHKVVLIPALVEYIFNNDDFANQQKRILDLLIREKSEAFIFLHKLVESERIGYVINLLVSLGRIFGYMCRQNFSLSHKYRYFYLTCRALQTKQRC